MGFFKKLLGLDEPQPSYSTRSENIDESGSLSRAYDRIDQAIQSWDRNEHAKAERLFKEGIEEYRRSEPSGLDYALGRYGAFLREAGRDTEAMAVLEQAIDLGTDIPAVWGDYAELRLEQQDLDGFWSTVERWAQSEGVTVIPDFVEMLLFQSRKADRNGNPQLAETLARRVFDLARESNHQEARWAAAGDLGHVLERAGRLDEAMELWEREFEDGSTDPKTADRLSMHLDRKKQYARAIQIVQQGLKRRLPANVEERLRKRMARCQSKLTGNKTKVKIPAFSVREGDGVLSLLFQTRVRPPVKEVAILGEVARCYGVSKGVGRITDVDLRTGEEIRHTPDLPKFTEIQFPTSESGLGIQRTAAIGMGKTNLVFLGPDGHVVAEASVPDATSQIAFDAGSWFVGCRDGNLYAFDSVGSSKWIWKTPGSHTEEEDLYSRPCPYFVAAARGMIVTASMEKIYAIDGSGRAQWEASLPHEKETKYTYTMPLDGGLDHGQAYSTLGLTPKASPDKIKGAYRAMAKSTHPDHNPGDPTAAERFRAVQAAYERLIAGPVEDAPSISFTISMTGMGPTASFLTAVDGGTVVGSSHGSVFVFDWKGVQHQARKLGDTFVHALSRPDGSLAAVWCDGLLSVLDGQNVVNAIDIEHPPRHMALLADDLFLAERNRAELLNSKGTALWVCDFSKQITAVAGIGDRIVCAAGVLAGFQRPAIGSPE